MGTFLTDDSLLPSRSLVTAVCSLIAAAGYIISATVSPEAYVVRGITSRLPLLSSQATITRISGRHPIIVTCLTVLQARYICLVISTTFVFAPVPSLLSFLASNTHTTAATGLATALNLTIGGGPGLTVGVWIYPAREAKTGYRSGNWINAAFMLAISVVAVGLRIYYGRDNRHRDYKRKFVL